MAADFSQLAAPAPATLVQTIGALVADLRKVELDMLEKELAFEQSKTEFNRLRLIVIPDAMVGLESLTLADGSIVNIKPDLNASISEDNRPEAFAWLRATGNGDVIKAFESVDIRGLTEKQLKAYHALLEKQGIVAEAKEAVHASTLKSLIKELLEKGTKLPPCFSVHQFKRAEVKAKKGR